MNLLLTGANGFVGKNFINYFIQNTEYHLLCLTRKKSNNIANPRIKWVLIDDFNEKINWDKHLSNINCVIHLAGQAHTKNSKKDKKFLQANYIATKKLAKECIKNEIDKFIFLSSIKVNGEFTLSNKPFTVEDTPSPKNIYSKYKYKIEIMLNELFKEKKISLGIIRSPIIYGPLVKANFNLMLNIIRFRIPIPFAAFKNKRSFISVDNLCDFILCFINHRDYLFDTYLISDDNDISTNELLYKISLVYKKKLLIYNLPKIIIVLVFKMLGLNSYLNKMYSNLQVDIDHAKNKMSWKPRYKMDYSLNQLLVDFAE